MAKQIDPNTLRSWLDAGEPVTVLDIRGDEDRTQWAIPGSLHINAYEALQSGDASALAETALPRDRPVITVCGAGRVSQTAAEVLDRRGFDARSLTGGMKAWSLAWNTADVPLSDESVAVLQVRRTGKGCLSYLVGSDGDAVVVDPSVAADVYVSLARERRWTIAYVVETHIHADHLSRARDLASRTGASLLLPPQPRVRFPFTALADGGRLRVGRARLTAVATPGHTAESTSYVLNDAAVFTGDTLFTNGVGRPDLQADPDEAKRRAHALFASLSRLLQLPRSLVVLSAHASDPIAFDRRPVAARLGEVERWLAGWMRSEPAFVDRLTSSLPLAPPNFARIVELNEAGEAPEGDPTDLEAGANRCAVR